MRNESRGYRRWAVAVAMMMLLSACGSDSSVHVNSPEGCDGSTGPQITGTVQMPNGKVARADGWLERASAMLWSAAAAINGDVSPVSPGVRVTLVELRPDDLAMGQEPGPVEIGFTRKDGQFCIGLPEGTDENICRYMLEVGNSDDHTLTRAFVFGIDGPIDIDFRSEAAVRVILATIPPANLCDFSPDDIRNIYDAVANAPGTAEGGDVDEINAVAATLAAADPGVQAAVATGQLPPPPPTPTRRPRTPTPAATATVTNTAPAPTRTAVPATRTAAPSVAPTRTATQAAGETPTTRAPTRTSTPG